MQMNTLEFLQHEQDKLNKFLDTLPKDEQERMHSLTNQIITVLNKDIKMSFLAIASLFLQRSIDNVKMGKEQQNV